ncbi:hypothetical protein IJI64_03225 [Candidatus Saccharibacteria bacterium]|nr:hypothetical protein [Candidatus Saccharibacteria bacterium]
MSNRKTAVASVVAVLTFVAFAGVTAFSVSNVSDLISRSSFSGKDGVPTAWTGTTYSSPVSTNTEVKNAGDHLAYLATIENKESNEVFLTDIASLISDNQHTGFITFNPSSIEYSYSKNSATWNTLSGINLDGVYKLNDAIRIGAAGTSSNRVYLRYNLSPDYGNVTDKISFRVKDINDNYSVAVSDSSIAYEETVNEVVAASSSRTNLDSSSSESAFAEPLGAFSEDSDLSTISTTTAAIAAISPESTTASIIIVIAILGLFVGSLIAFLVIKNHNQKTSKNR